VVTKVPDCMLLVPMGSFVCSPCAEAWQHQIFKKKSSLHLLLICLTVLIHLMLMAQYAAESSQGMSVQTL
jgi:hypothetical protein